MKHTRPQREVLELCTWQNFSSRFVKYGHERLVSLSLVYNLQCLKATNLRIFFEKMEKGNFVC